jgi:hypothetical protein
MRKHKVGDHLQVKLSGGRIVEATIRQVRYVYATRTESAKCGRCAADAGNLRTGARTEGLRRQFLLDYQPSLV